MDDYIEIGNKKFKVTDVEKYRKVFSCLAWITIILSILLGRGLLVKVIMLIGLSPIWLLFFHMSRTYQKALDEHAQNHSASETPQKDSLSQPSDAGSGSNTKMEVHVNVDHHADSIKTQNASISTCKSKKLTVAGTSFKKEAIESLGEENDDYSLSKKELVEQCMTDEKIYQYNFYPYNTELVEEPDNPYDFNAIKVLIDGVHVGYIPKESCKSIKNLLYNKHIVRIDSDICGGNFKLVSENEDDCGTYSMQKSSYNYSIKIEIFYEDYKK